VNGDPNLTTLQRIADWCLLAVYLPSLAWYGIYRWRVGRKLASIGIMLGFCGWLVIPLWDFGVLPHTSIGLFRWLGVAAGIFVLASALLAERRDPGGKLPR
jgi:hypothetical protein